MKEERKEERQEGRSEGGGKRGRNDNTFILSLFTNIYKEEKNLKT